MATSTDRLCLFAATAIVPSLAAGTALAAGGTGTALNAAHTAVSEAQPLSAAAVIERIVELSTAGELVRAEAMIEAFVSSPASISVSDAESLRVFQLQRDLARRIRRADPNDLSVQRATLSLRGDDLIAAEQHARAVIASAMATGEQKASAQGVLTVVEISRQQLASRLDSRIASAANAFGAGSYGIAREDFERIVRSGVALSPEQSRLVSSHLTRLRALNGESGSAFASLPGAGGDSESAVTLSSLQPGVANRTDWNRASGSGGAGASGAQPAGTPAAEPAAGEPAAAEPVEDVLMTARRLQAESLLAEADAAWQGANYAEAARLYRQAIEQGQGLLSPAVLAAAETNLTEAEVLLRGNLPSGQPLRDGLNTRELARQQTDAEFANALEQARSALATGDTGAARTAASTAKLVLSNGRDLYNIATYEDMLSRADDLLLRIDDAEERRRVEELIDAQSTAERQAQTDRLRKAREIDDKIAG
jgi:hypothetical protein